MLWMPFSEGEWTFCKNAFKRELRLNQRPGVFHAKLLLHECMTLIFQKKNYCDVSQQESHRIGEFDQCCDDQAQEEGNEEDERRK